jgi:hypothetical protein
MSGPLTGTAFLRRGAISQLLVSGGLFASNVLAPRLLGIHTYGHYAELTGVVFLALGLIDAPLSLRLLTADRQATKRLLAIKAVLAPSVAVAAGIVAGQSPSTLLIVAVYAFAFSMYYAYLNIAYRTGETNHATALSLNIVIGLAIGFFAGSIYHLGAVSVLTVQCAAILAGTTAIASGIRRRQASSTHDIARKQQSAPLLALALPSVIVAGLQGAAVVVAGATHGPEAAGYTRLLCAVGSIPFSIIPLSGGLLLAASIRAPQSRQWMRNMTLMAGTLSLLAGFLTVLARPLISVLVTPPIFDSLAPLFLIAVSGGVGLSMFQLAWPYCATMRLAGISRRLVTISFLVAPFGVLIGTQDSWHLGIELLAALYTAAGLMVLSLLLTSSGSPRTQERAQSRCNGTSQATQPGRSHAVRR